MVSGAQVAQSVFLSGPMVSGAQMAHDGLRHGCQGPSHRTLQRAFKTIRSLATLGSTCPGAVSTTLGTFKTSKLFKHTLVSIPEIRPRSKQQQPLDSVSRKRPQFQFSSNHF